MRRRSRAQAAQAPDDAGGEVVHGQHEQQAEPEQPAVGRQQRGQPRQARDRLAAQLQPYGGIAADLGNRAPQGKQLFGGDENLFLEKEARRLQTPPTNLQSQTETPRAFMAASNNHGGK